MYRDGVLASSREGLADSGSHKSDIIPTRDENDNKDVAAAVSAQLQRYLKHASSSPKRNCWLGS